MQGDGEYLGGFGGGERIRSTYIKSFQFKMKWTVDQNSIGHEVPPLAVELLLIVSIWERERQIALTI